MWTQTFTNTGGTDISLALRLHIPEIPVGDESDPGFGFEPRYVIDPLSFSFTLDTIHPGDILSYVYTLTADGTTLGFEHGYLAFLGDPFDLSASGGSLEVAAAVPEPATWLLSLAGAIWIGGMLRRQCPGRACVRQERTDHCRHRSAP